MQYLDEFAVNGFSCVVYPFSHGSVDTVLYGTKGDQYRTMRCHIEDLEATKADFISFLKE